MEKKANEQSLNLGVLAKQEPLKTCLAQVCPPSKTPKSGF
jgi:hypothetical protein